MFKTAAQGDCGSALQLVVRGVASSGATGGASLGGEGGDEVIKFWGCSRWPECDFRDVLPRRLAQPRLCLEAAGSDGFKVAILYHPLPWNVERKAAGACGVSPEPLCVVHTDACAA